MKIILKSRQNGFAIIEALIAFLLLGIGVAALLYLQGNLMSGSSESKARAEAMELAKGRMEMLRNYIQRDQYLYALSSAQSNEPVGGVPGVNALYNVSYVNIPSLIDDVQQLTIKVIWTGSEGNPKEVTLDTMLYFIDPSVTVAVDGGGDGGGSVVPMVAPWITGVEGEHPSTAPIKLADGDSSDDDIATADDDLLEIEINRYFAATGTLTGRSNVEVLYDTDGDGDDEVVLTSFGGIVHKIKGKVITDRFSVPLDVYEPFGSLDQDELRNFWIDLDRGDGDDNMEICEVRLWIDDDNGDDIIQVDEFTGEAGLDVNDDGIIEEAEIGDYWVDGDCIMQVDEVKYWIDGDNGGVVDGIIQDIEYTFWVDANLDGVVDVSEFDPPEATAAASSTIGDLSVLGSPPSFCVFPICDDPLDTDTDCKVPVNDPNNDDDPANNDVDEYGIASYVCYVPGDCTYQDIYSKDTDDDVVLNGCPSGFIQPTDDDFDDLNGGWYGRIGNFGVKLNPDDMVCTTETTKTHLTPSREYVTYRWDWGCSDGTLTDETTCNSSGGSWSWMIIGNEGINTPYSNQTFIIARKNNKASVYCPVRALSYPGNLVNEQIKRELVGVKVFDDTGQPTTPDWEKNVVLPENECTTGLSCPP